MTVKDQLDASCEEALDFPKNLIRHNTYEHSIDSYYERLNEHESRLFHNEAQATVDFSEFDAQGKDFWHTCVRNVAELRKQLRIRSNSEHEDPRCRFVFIYARNGRERLKTTRQMLMTIFSYHQVMPAVLDFLFPFGRQEYAKDFLFSGFRQDTCLAGCERGLQIPELGWSGLGVQLCYSLKSVEASPSQPEWPWSIRQCAIHHSLDLESGRANWIVIKGDQLMKTRVRSAMKSSRWSEKPSFETVDRCFAATLAFHLILCEWSGENWRWYINFLDEQFQALTRRTLTSIVDTPSSPITEEPSSPRTPRTSSRVTTGFSSAGKMRVNTSLSSRITKNIRVNTNLSNPFSEKTLIQHDESPRNKFSEFQPQRPVTPPATPPLSQSPFTSPELLQEEVQPEFSFSDLQKINFIEEKANETLLVLKTNINVLTELREHYRFIADSEHFSQELKSKCKGELSRFDKRIAVVANDHRMQQSRVETLVRLLDARKNLLYGILEYRNMEASKFLAIKAHQSTRNMEVITRDTQSSTSNMEKSTKDMHEIAQKTKQETVSMRIITLVTLFFLPGTFISKTLMSTDIVNFKPTSTGSSGSRVELAALQLYLAISLPLVCVTLLAWYGFYWWEVRKERMNQEKVDREAHESGVESLV